MVAAARDNRWNRFGEQVKLRMSWRSRVDEWPLCFSYYIGWQNKDKEQNLFFPQGVVRCSGATWEGVLANWLSQQCLLPPEALFSFNCQQHSSPSRCVSSGSACVGNLPVPLRHLVWPTSIHDVLAICRTESRCLFASWFGGNSAWLVKQPGLTLKSAVHISLSQRRTLLDIL